MQEIISPYTIEYKGKLSDRHIVYSEDLALSILGASKVSTSIIHYIFTGKVPRANYKKQYVCVTNPPKSGSYEWNQWIVPMASTILADPPAFIWAVEFLFQKTWDKLVNTLARDSTKSIETMGKVFTDINQQNSEAGLEALKIFAQSMDKSNKNLTDIVSRQAEIIEKYENHSIETMPDLAKVNKTNAVNFVQPVGNSCTFIENHFYNGFDVNIDPAKAEVIRSKEPDTVGDETQYECIRITELNLNNGHCFLDLSGFDDKVTGEISDPSLNRPSNIYSNAFDKHTSLILTAKPILRDDEVIKIHISNAQLHNDKS